MSAPITRIISQSGSPPPPPGGRGGGAGGGRRGGGGGRGGRAGEARGQAQLRGRLERGERLGGGPEPFGRVHRPAGVEPLGRFEPVAKLARVVVEAEGLQHEGKSAGGRMILRELMMIEIVEGRLVAMSDVHNANRRAGEIVS